MYTQLTSLITCGVDNKSDNQRVLDLKYVVIFIFIGNPIVLAIVDHKRSPYIRAYKCVLSVRNCQCVETDSMKIV